MTDTTGRDHNSFGVSVNQSADVQASGGGNSNMRAAHTVRCQYIFEILVKGALREKLTISSYYLTH
jgi:hypothetical protein